MTTKSEILHEVRDAMIAAERKHGDQLNVPLGCSFNFTESAEVAKLSTDLAFKAGTGTWMHIAYEEAMECFAEEDLDKIRTEALQAAAMFAQIARVCDHLKEKDSPLESTNRVHSPEYGWGTVRAIQPNRDAAWILWDDAAENGILANKELGTMYSLSWARRLERAK